MKTLFSLSGIRLGTPHIIDFKIHVPARSIQKFAICLFVLKRVNIFIVHTLGF